MTLTARTLDLLRRSGFVAAVVETWIPHINRRRDLFGCFDVLALHPVRREIVLVQTTTVSNLPARIAKVRACPMLPAILAAGAIVQLHGWACRGGRWQAKIVNVRAEDLAAVVDVPLPRRRPARFRQGQLFADMERI